MKLFCCALLFTSAATLSSAGQGLSPVVFELVEKAMVLTDDMVAGDLDAVLAATDPRFIEMMGGSDAAARVTRQRLESMRAQGLVTDDVKIVLPTAVYEAEAYRVVLIPQRIVVVGDNGAIVAKGYVVASQPKSDDGGEWSFIDGHAFPDAKSLRAMFPGLSDDVIIPDKMFDWLPNYVSRHSE